MHLLTLLITVFLAFTSMTLGQSGRFLYASTPDGAQTEGRSGNGILVFDIDNGHKLVKRIDIPIFKEGIRGFTGNLKTHSVYYSTTNRRVGAYDLETEKIVWEKTYPSGADRSSITMDGKKLYVPTGWWYSGADSGFLIVNAENGDLIRRINVGPQAHNSIASLDGRYVYLGTETMLTQFDTKTDRIVKQIKDVGERGIFPYTVDSRNEYAYVCLGNHIGFDMVDLKSGKAVHRVFVNPDNKIEHRTHGAALTPDEKELWISDQRGQKLFYFDATQMPPKQMGSVSLSIAGHGWVTFSLDGKYAYSHAPDIYDAKTKKKIGTFKDENGNPIASSKFVEVHLRNGKVVKMGHEFGLGRAHHTDD